MKNPATELYELFLGWKNHPNQNPYVSRGFSTEPADAYEDHLNAMTYMAAIRTAVARMESEGYNVAAFRRSYKLWTTVILNVPHAWNQDNINHQVLTDHALDTLEILAAALDRYSRPVEKTEGISAYLDDIAGFLHEDADISHELRSHISKILQTIRKCLDEDAIYGETDLQQSLYDLWIALFAAEGQTGAEGKGKWRDFAEKIWQPTASGFLASIPSLGVGVLQLVQGAQ